MYIEDKRYKIGTYRHDEEIIHVQKEGLPFVVPTVNTTWGPWYIQGNLRMSCARAVSKCMMQLTHEMGKTGCIFSVKGMFNIDVYTIGIIGDDVMIYSLLVLA